MIRIVIASACSYVYQISIKGFFSKRILTFLGRFEPSLVDYYRKAFDDLLRATDADMVDKVSPMALSLPSADAAAFSQAKGHLCL